MSFGIGLGDLALILQTCVAVYKQFKEADETIKDAHDRIDVIRSYVNTVIGGLNDKFGSKEKYPKSEDFLKIVKRMDTKAKEVKRIFRKYKEIQLQPNIFGAGWYQLLYVCGSSTHELQTLIGGLEKNRDDLAHQYVAVMLLSISPSPNNLISQPHSPGQHNTRPAVNILFLDSENTGRSVVAQAYAMLVSEWTKRTNHEWKINSIHSAGIDVVHKCGMMEVRKLLPAELYEGKELPSLSAQSALFDKPYFNYPYKANIRQKIGGRLSRGLDKNTFSEFDYIFVFTLNHLWAIQKLLVSARTKYPNLVAKGKHRFVVLGEYGNSTSGSNIWGPKKGQSDQEKKEYWNRTVANIKVSFKGWLKEELDWKQPPKGAPQS